MPADLPPPPPALERSILHDARAIHDCAALRFADLLPSPENRWVIALIEPAPGSGAATIPGASLQGGKINVPSGATTVVQKKGKWKRTALQSVEWPVDGTYSWNEPIDRPVRALTPEDVYSPFADGGVIFFRPLPEKKGLEQFGRVTLVPREWAPFVAQAVAYVGKQGVAPGAQPPAEALQKMSGSENPILALVGFREIVVLRELNAVEAAGYLDRARGPLRAAFVTVLILRSRPAVEDVSVSGVIDRAMARDTLLPIATGALAVVLLDGPDAAAVARAKSALLRVKQRAAQLGGPLASDETLAQMYRLAGLTP